MTTLQYIHFSIELWGAFFCIIAVVNIALKRAFDVKGSAKLVALMANSALLMISDAFAWIYRGDISQTGYYAVRIANFCAFFFGFLTMPLVAEYITHIIRKRSGISGLYWKYIEWALFIAGAAIVIINTRHQFIYAFDARNTYYRLQLGFLPGVIAFIGIVITLGVVLEYISYMHPFEKVATVAYLILPIIAVVIQSLRYGVSFTYLSLVASSLTLFISHEVNYYQYNAEKEKNLAEERIRLFNQQIQPHFIFNSLAVIKHLCSKDAEEARTAIDEFSGYMRSSTDLMNAKECVPVSRELDLVKHYVYMQQKNFGDSIEFNYDIQDTDFSVPPFSIQTSVENALKHGLRSEVMNDGRLDLRTYRKGSAHYIEIEDNGVGFDTSILEDDSHDNCIGIRNTKERLRLMCGGTIDIKSETGKGTKVTVRIPED
jgi:sensor histidine kinase YesM